MLGVEIAAHFTIALDEQAGRVTAAALPGLGHWCAPRSEKYTQRWSVYGSNSILIYALSSS